jgi:hypothetical protein
MDQEPFALWRECDDGCGEQLAMLGISCCLLGMPRRVHIAIH